MNKPNFSLQFRVFLCFAFLSITIISAQEYFPKNDGVKTKNDNYTAFTNANIIVSPSQTIKNGILLIKDGKVSNVGTNITIPKNTVKINLEGKSIYPSFIDAYANFGIAKPKAQRGGFGQAPQYDTKRKGYYWNEHIRAETNALDVFKYDSKKAEELRKAGFGVVNTHLQDGIVRGNGILVALNSEGSDADRLLDVNSGQFLSFNKSSASRQVYPTSLMGAMALLRQLYMDADWYAKGHVNTKDLTLEAFNRNKNLKQIFFAGDKHNALRADKIGDQFGIQYSIVGKGNEYQLVNEIKNTNATFIIPINFPKAYDVANPYQADHVNLEDMRYWNQAPTNLGILAKNNIPFSITTSGIKSLKDFSKNLQKAIDYGLDKTKALEALTTIPAQILGKSNQIGSLSKGMQANFLITDGDIFDAKTKLYENWVQGTKNVIIDRSVKDLSGNYTLNLSGTTYDLTFSGDAQKPKVAIKKDSTKLKGSVIYKDNWLGLVIMNKDAIHRLDARIHSDSDNINGNAIMANGQTVSWLARKKPSEAKEKKDKKDKKLHDIMPLTYPNIGYGFSEKPKEETILFKNATVWTNETEGILKNTDVLLKNGKIAKIGTNLSAGSARVVDATGKHLTAGIVDEHTHVAAQSVNEAGQNSSAEVTIEDNIDSEDINIYRNLGGGVTSMQILHGSANPIGGRSAIVKLKWGEIGDDMIYTNTPKFIKFALGENVKQSRYPITTNRFPQSRMGVEQMVTDYFQRAKEYDAVKKSGKPYRKDIEMDVIAEILNKERYITAHSYVQSEINMLMKVAEKFDFNINTFTHILEGYKVADKMKAHGVGGSTFSDWWAYKYEVNDAIPFNAAIMHNVGVVTAINSDDREMSRRLNQEAAKTVKYGGVSEEDAWKFVTLNPAKLLHIDDRVGSIKVGKDADVVLWTDHPLSVYAKAEKTIIEGKVYFDLEKDKMQRIKIQKERNQLINMMLSEKNGGAPTQAPKKKVKKELHCDTINN